MLNYMVLRGAAQVMGVLALTIGVQAGSAVAGGAKKPKPAPKQPVAVVDKDDAKKPAAGGAAAATTVDLATFLVKPAEQAMKDRKYERAVALYRGIVAIRGDADESMWQLAEAWRVAGEANTGADELERYEAAITDQAKKQKAAAMVQEMRAQEKGFAGGRFTPGGADKEGQEAFKLGRVYYKKKQYAEAVLLFKAGTVMAPDVKGNIRELAQAYDALGQTAEANEFFTRYLRVHPFGKNADEVRVRLAKVKLTGTMTIQSSLPCEQIWVNGQQASVKLPVKVDLAAGNYKALCVNLKYHHIQYEYAKVENGQVSKLSFDWAIVVNKLNPWARVVMENPYDPTKMQDVGLFEEFGVKVPDDRRSLKVHLKAGDNSQEKDVLLKLEPGKTVALSW